MDTTRYSDIYKLWCADGPTADTAHLIEFFEHWGKTTEMSCCSAYPLITGKWQPLSPADNTRHHCALCLATQQADIRTTEKMLTEKD